MSQHESGDLERAAINQAAKALANQLGETRIDARDAIKRLVRQHGLPFANEHYLRAIEIERRDGLLKADGKRRSLGGVFFHLVKNTLGVVAFRAAVPPSWRMDKERRAKEKQRAAAKAAALAASAVQETQPGAGVDVEPRA